MTPTEMESRIKVLEGHRDQWRRIAFRLFSELEKHDAEAANGIVDNYELWKEKP